MRRSSTRRIVFKGAAWAVAVLATATGIGASVTVAVGWAFSASMAPRAKFQMAMPIGPALVALAPPEDMPTGSIGRSASASTADRAIFVPRLDFLVKPAPTLAALSASSDLKLKLRDTVPLPPSRPKLAYARPDFDVSPMPTQAETRTAVYDIEASTVYLPSGRKLEAHSGLGGLMDDPTSLRIKNRGVTPPNTYDLKLRESLFHGVQAIRMNPVDEGKMFNRDGILAHSYMLGPSGQSNGCVSFRDYPAFLKAFLNGEVDRMVVLERGGKQRAAQLHGLPIDRYAFDGTPSTPLVNRPTRARSAAAAWVTKAESPKTEVW